MPGAMWERLSCAWSVEDLSGVHDVVGVEDLLDRAHGGDLGGGAGVGEGVLLEEADAVFGGDGAALGGDEGVEGGVEVLGDGDELVGGKVVGLEEVDVEVAVAEVAPEDELVMGGVGRVLGGEQVGEGR